MSNCILKAHLVLALVREEDGSVAVHVAKDRHGALQVLSVDEACTLLHKRSRLVKERLNEAK